MIREYYALLLLRIGGIIITLAETQLSLCPC